MTINTGANTKDWQLRRDWAALAGGGSIADFNGPDYTPFGCGPTGAIDQSQGNGWGSDTDNGLITGFATDKFIVVKLPVKVDVSQMAVNPSNTCGDPGSSSTRGWRIEVSTDGASFAMLVDGVFYSGNRNRMNTVFTGSSTGVQYVRFWILNPRCRPIPRRGRPAPGPPIEAPIPTTTPASPPTAGQGRTTGTAAVPSWTWSSWPSTARLRRRGGAVPRGD